MDGVGILIKINWRKIGYLQDEGGNVKFDWMCGDDIQRLLLICDVRMVFGVYFKKGVFVFYRFILKFL